MKRRSAWIMMMVIAIILSSCSPTDNRRVSEVFDSGEMIECSFMELMTLANGNEYTQMRISYRRDAFLLEIVGSDNFLMSTRKGTLEPLLEQRHSQIYGQARDMGCDYMLSEELTHEFIVRDRMFAGRLDNAFGGIPLIMNERMTLSQLEAQNNDKAQFMCKAIIPDTRFEIEGKECDVSLFQQ